MIIDFHPHLQKIDVLKKIDSSSPSLTQQPPLASTSSKGAHSIKFTVYFFRYFIFKILLLCMVSLQERFVINSGL